MTWRFLAIAVAVLLSSAPAYAQSANYRAQGRYYSAKEAHDAGRYADAARMLVESRDFLGGSNERLQFLLVLSLYKAGRYRDAQVEMNRFFDLSERREPQKHFSKDVDALTSDEVRQITMILDKIDAHVASNSEGKAEADRQRATATADLERRRDHALSELNSFIRSQSGVYAGHERNRSCSGTSVVLVDHRKYYYADATIRYDRPSRAYRVAYTDQLTRSHCSGAGPAQYTTDTRHTFDFNAKDMTQTDIRPAMESDILSLRRSSANLHYIVLHTGVGAVRWSSSSSDPMMASAAFVAVTATAAERARVNELLKVLLETR